MGYDLGRQLIDKDHSSTWSTTSPATPSTLALLPASAAGYFQALYHTVNGLLKALHHVPAYLLEFSSNHWISPSPSTSTQRSSSLTSPRLNFQRAAPKSPVLSPSLKDTYVFYTSKFQLQGPRTPASSLSQSQRAAPSHIGPRSAVINAFRLQSYFAVRIRNLSKYRTAHKTDLSQVGYPETNMENSPPSTDTAGKAGSLCYFR